MDKMNRREFLKKSALGLSGLALIGSRPLNLLAQVAQENNLNVLFIMTDQHNARALGCYGHPVVQTPNMDRLAEEGVRFENAFCQTGQCCPSRYTTWTGRYRHSHELWSNGVMESLDEITVGEVFSDAGYVTATIGKHHMQNDPTLHGFSHVVEISDYNAFLTTEGTPDPSTTGTWLNVPLPGRTGITNVDNEHHRPGFWASKTIEFLQNNVDNPFCCWCSFYGPHTPIYPSRPWGEMYDWTTLSLPPNFTDELDPVAVSLQNKRDLYSVMTENDHRKVMALYYGLVSQIDYNIGRVLDELDTLGLADRTIVVYTADHGESLTEHGIWTKTTTNYDCTIRIPMIIRLPGVLPAGIVSDDLVGLVDLMPTLCDLCGVPIPGAVEGHSLVPLMLDQVSVWRPTIFSEIGPETNFSTMARTKRFKYVYHMNGGSPFEEFFDLRKDPWETKNEIDNPKYAGYILSLKSQIEDWKAGYENWYGQNAATQWRYYQ